MSGEGEDSLEDDEPIELSSSTFATIPWETTTTSDVYLVVDAQSFVPPEIDIVEAILVSDTTNSSTPTTLLVEATFPTEATLLVEVTLSVEATLLGEATLPREANLPMEAD